MKESINRVGGIMVYDLVTIAQEQLEKALDRYKQRMEERMKNDEERKKQIELEDALKSKKGFIPTTIWGGMNTESAVDPSKEAESMNEEQENQPILHSGFSGGIHVHPRQFIGPVSNILKVLPPTLEITRVRVHDNDYS